MTKLLANRASVLLAAAIFVAATWLNTSIETRTAPTTFALTQPEQTTDTVASLEKAPRL